MGERHEVSVKWGTWRSASPYLLPIALAGAAFSALAFGDEQQVSPALALVPLVFCVMLSVVFVARSTNVTTFYFGGGRLVSKTRPIPVGGAIDVEVSAVERFALVSHRFGTDSAASSPRMTVKLASGASRTVPNNPLTGDDREAVLDRLNAALAAHRPGAGSP